jgi:hypothetical protein
LNSRSHREQLLSQKLLQQNRVGSFAAATVEHPRAPRPNSAGLRTGATPRARSSTERGSSGGSGHSARGPSPNRSPEVAEGYQPSVSKKGSSPFPPSLPLLRQEA